MNIQTITIIIKTQLLNMHQLKYGNDKVENDKYVYKDGIEYLNLHGRLI
jgi:hypothetical protein